MFALPLDSKQALIQWLNPCLPTCIALYRRLQFGHFTPGSRLFSSVDLTILTHGKVPSSPWIVAFVDRTCRPETEVWIAASWEHDTPADDSWLPQADDLVRSLLKEISKAEIIPQASSPITGSDKSTSLPADTNGNGSVDRDQYEKHLMNEKVVLLGAVHSSTVAILKRLGLLDSSFVGSDMPYQKYIFDLRNDVVPRSLPPGFAYGKVDPKDYGLVKSRTQIPRQDRTLRKLPSVAIYHEQGESTASTPIAWGFLGLDASLTTLHVEKDYRGLGLAKSLSLKLFSDDMGAYWQHNPSDEERYAHADVATDNSSSQGTGG
ncbi:hypothetical protein D6D03_00094 [Aureobasidium pullulans]|nr:hypothetical protein D6D03_00094 [Aureobasidium pullulans]